MGEGWDGGPINMLGILLTLLVVVFLLYIFFFSSLQRLPEENGLNPLLEARGNMMGRGFLKIESPGVVRVSFDDTFAVIRGILCSLESFVISYHQIQSVKRGLFGLTIVWHDGAILRTTQVSLFRDRAAEQLLLEKLKK